MIGSSIYSGVLLMEFTQYCSTSSTKSISGNIRRTLASVIGILALIICGFPEANWTWSSWSDCLAKIGYHIFPAGTEQHRMWPSIGITLLMLSITCLPEAQHILSHQWLVWLGTISFPLYLLHGPLVRSLLAWLLYGWHIIIPTGTNDAGDRLPWPAWWMHFWALPIFFMVLGCECNYWNSYIEPWCARATKKAEEIMCPRNTDDLQVE